MATSTEEITLDIDALDAEAAKKSTNGADKSAKTTVEEPVTVETVAPEAKQPEKKVVTPEEGLQKLQKQLDDEKAARLAAEQRANEAAQGEAKARAEVQTSQLDQIKGAIEQITQHNDALESSYADAMAAQDWKAAAKAQRQMADNAAKLAQLESGKVALEKAPKPVPRAPADPVEQFCAQLSAPSAAWVRSHPEFVRDQHKNQQMLAAHQLAVARGYKADTPEYFGSIEKTLEITPAVTKTTTELDEHDDPMADAAKPVNGAGRTASSAPASAPVSRGGNGSGSRPNVVKLSAAEVEIAQAMGMTAEEYARNKVALRKEGKLS
jgi:hypothetical protein